MVITTKLDDAVRTIATTKNSEKARKRTCHSASSSKRKKRETPSLRKAPQAPKRFRSSYICFFTAKQPEIKKELGDEATVGEISRRSAHMWKLLSPEDRRYWDDVAAKDKQRYLAEKASYVGPWQVPYKRAKKDPSAPKRPMSAFLHFTKGRRSQIKSKNPDMKNTEVSKILGELWRKCTEEERKPYVETEKVERGKYKIAMSKWKEEQEERQKKESEQSPKMYHLPPVQQPYQPPVYHHHPPHHPARHGEYFPRDPAEKEVQQTFHDCSYAHFQPPVTESVRARYDNSVILDQSCALSNYEVPQYAPPPPFPNVFDRLPSFDDGYHYEQGGGHRGIQPLSGKSMA